MQSNMWFYNKLNHSLPDEDDVSLLRDQSHAGHHSSRPDQQHGYDNGLRHQQQHSEQEDGHQHGQEEDLLSLEPDQQELGQEEQGAVGEHQEQHVLTDTIANGIAVMDQQLETIEQKVRELTAAGLERLDLIKQGFADAMEA
ncbi:hypothetical protein HaLaN_07356 [Haematococcus lacustris]|uniref:Uncharacterized protein n=1 Tax=Haematococcus lacustris TaxID=44745 RepID=A0A699YW19_HAELA|nr:hypothetical protein HaLaN_07356 [Haematococcus lacustris]